METCLSLGLDAGPVISASRVSIEISRDENANCARARAIDEPSAPPLPLLARKGGRKEREREIRLFRPRGAQVHLSIYLPTNLPTREYEDAEATYVSADAISSLV